MTKERLKILTKNLVTYLDSKNMQFLSLEEKINILKEEIGITDKEIKELELEECLNLF